MLILLALSPFLAPDQDLNTSLRLKRSPFSDLPIATVQIDIGASRLDGETRLYWLRKTERLKGKATVTWTDTARCEAAKWVVEQVPTVTPPSLSPYGELPDEIIVKGSNARYILEANAHYNGVAGSEISFSGVDGTPLAVFIEESIQKLAPCWTKRRTDSPAK